MKQETKTKQGSRFKQFALVVLAFLMSPILAACGSQASAGENSTGGDISGRPINVIATVGMAADMVRNIGGDRVNVQALMGAGIDPHLYRPTAGDVERLSGADMIFYVGLNLEGKMAGIFERLEGKTYAIAAGIPTDQLLPYEETFFDPHIWFDVNLWSQGIDSVRDALIKIDPGSAEGYRTRAEAYRARLTALDEYVRTSIATIPEEARVMITAHDAFEYFGRRYGIEVEGLQGISTEAEAGVDDVRALVDLVVERQIPAIFIESSVPARTIEAVKEAASARGWNVEIGGELFSDALGNEGTPEGTYIGMILYNTATITNALGGSAPAVPESLK
jgi:manganese/zinc/iron transport system substrate-binding protein